MYLLNEPYEVHSMCCQKLKKDPFHRYEKETGLYPILGTMASESKMRETRYLLAGSCNTFNDNNGGGEESPTINLDGTRYMALYRKI